MSEPASAHSPLYVACLCAGWCRTCDDYRATFNALAREFAGEARFDWVDIEDDEALLGSVDVVDFPTVLIARGDQIAFFGPVMPQALAARQLVQRALEGRLGAVADASLLGLPGRLRDRG